MDDTQARSRGGFSLIEFLIILSSAVVLLTSVDSWLANYKVRSKVSEALSVAETARRDVVITCGEEPHIQDLSKIPVVKKFEYSPYVGSITVDGSCVLPRITLETANTGLSVEPILVIEGHIENGMAAWTCHSTGLEIDTPERCRAH
ncbi:MAG: hypothetical protein R3212_09045 [Xanthomonadales bacterium]|nr:hypothetical protein [Xanthomonadales bacterium]